MSFSRFYFSSLFRFSWCNLFWMSCIFNVIVNFLLSWYGKQPVKRCADMCKAAFLRFYMRHFSAVCATLSEAMRNYAKLVQGGVACIGSFYTGQFSAFCATFPKAVRNDASLVQGVVNCIASLFTRNVPAVCRGWSNMMRKFDWDDVSCSASVLTCQFLQFVF